ncbi:tRNA lysidine(34) synthetase TilS [Herbiconiux sp.]|uniref:tRNA lysidine(34) synthetase TilS n=1 Tax=Herbiconiux sp. TaxID=1871186 RepID=UPI0025BBAC12|nr:tRNA lysidine(34) synthetase TilS [Herbiconiux sp.]
MDGRRPRLTPAIADVRRAVRECLEQAGPTFVLVALSGGPDSLALAAATAFEAPRRGIRAGAVVVDHGLQEGSAEVAERAAAQARELGLDPVIVERVDVEIGPASRTGGTEAAARTARYAALDRALATAGGDHVLLGHTLDDQAETVLLGLARGAGATSLSGMEAATPAEPETGRAARLRPLLGIRRSTTEAFCTDSGLDPWNDPHNEAERFTRVRVRHTVLPLLEAELGPGIAEALARTAEQLREDDETLHDIATETIEDLVEHAEAGIAVSARALAANPPALRNRIIRYVVESEFGVSPSRAQTLAVAALATDWHGQKGVDLPGIRVVRQAALLVFTRTDQKSAGQQSTDEQGTDQTRTDHEG